MKCDLHPDFAFFFRLCSWTRWSQDPLGRPETHYILRMLPNVAWYGTFFQTQPKLNETRRRYYGPRSPADVRRCSALPEATFERRSERMRDVPNTGSSVCRSPAFNTATYLDEFPLGCYCNNYSGDSKVCVYSSSLYLIKHQILCVYKSKCTIKLNMTASVVKLWHWLAFYLLSAG